MICLERCPLEGDANQTTRQNFLSRVLNISLQRRRSSVLTQNLTATLSQRLEKLQQEIHHLLLFFRGERIVKTYPSWKCLALGVLLPGVNF